MYCLSVNYAFTMFQRSKHFGVKQVKVLPEGNGDFTRGMGMVVKKETWALVSVPGVMPCWSMIKASSNY
jgi:peroxiredoxin